MNGFEETQKITKNFVDYLDLMSKEDLAHIILEKLMKVKGE